MPPTKHSEEEEAMFMNNLLGGLDDSFFDTSSSPNSKSVHPPPHDRTPLVRTPLKPKYSSSGSRSTVVPTMTKENQPRASEDVEMTALIDGADNWDWEDMESDFITPRKPKNKTQNSILPASQSSFVRETFTRCTIEQVEEVAIKGRYRKLLKETNRYYHALISRTLAIRKIKLGVVKEVLCYLHLDYDELPRKATQPDSSTNRYSQLDFLRICQLLLHHINIATRLFCATNGDVINVIGTFESLAESTSTSPTACISITSKANYIIHHPDILLTATAISNAPQCRRKPLLSALVRSSSDVTPSLVWGNMLHEVMQTCLSENLWEETWIDGRIDDVVRRGLGDLVKIGVGIDEAKREVKKRAQGLEKFADRYISQTPKAEAILTNTRSTQDQKALLAISKLHDVEEDIWSPKYGLKGKIDASVQAVVEERDSPFDKPKTRSYPMPLELKTGRVVAGMEHRAQTMLYTLLMMERYNLEVPSGLLYYTHTDEVVRVPTARNELKGLILARNEMASYTMRRHQATARGKEVKGLADQADVDEVIGTGESFLPPTIDDERICKKCYALDTCMLYRKAIENVEDTTSPIADVYELKTSHLTSSQTSFFKKWEALIALEERDLVRFKKELWTMGAKEREEKGRCFASMIMDSSYRAPSLNVSNHKEGKIHQYTYKFVRNTNHGSASLLNGHMSCGDAVTVSVEPDLLALGRGFITELTPTEVVLGVDHELRLDNILARLRARGTSESDPFNNEVICADTVIFRIDRDELFSGMGRIRDNLAQLFYVDGDGKRLKLVVDLEAPQFDEDIRPEMSSQLAVAQNLNINQRDAMEKVMTAQDYALILGMPGTGKTTVIAAIIKALVSMGKTVLLTSYTHSAVDTILLKLKGDVDFGILRLGNVDKVHPDAQEFTLAARRPAATIEQLEHQLMTPPVVATTCLSIDHPVFLRRKFDYCIVDEASQITLPTCLGPLRYADKFVLVGDHFQLPPLVRSVAARKGGLDVSLFRRLSDNHPHAVVDLAYQYRMNEDIMLLSNKLIYGDRLRCGSEEVARRGLVLPNREIAKSIHGQSCLEHECWLRKLMAESCKAVFVDTDTVPARDSRVGDLVQNEVEAALVQQVTDAFLSAGVREDQIGIISLYRQQIKLLSHLLQERKGIEILTADRSQGRDKDCIIISMVRSNDAGQIGDLVKDWRRMNVSFTRARSKLIIFGSRKTLQAAPLLSEFFVLMESKGWILQLPPKADTMHSSTGQGLSGKRSAEDVGRTCVAGSASMKENGGEESASMRPTKKLKRTKVEDGLMRGRPILKDLVNGGR